MGTTLPGFLHAGRTEASLMRECSVPAHERARRIGMNG
jgi:hypothetical protein